MPGQALFDHAVMQAKLAQRTSVIKGILWHQGETDCAPERAAHYTEKLDTIMTALRHQLDLPTAPLLVGGLGEFLPECQLQDYFSNAAIVDTALQRFAQERENCFYVSAKGLESNPDHLHFNAESQRLFGLRYFEAYDKKRSVTEPLPTEQEFLLQLSVQRCTPPEERIKRLKQQLSQGEIGRYEYHIRMDALIEMI